MINSGKLGIFRGTFDPIHRGHIEFAKQALNLASLDVIYFLVEPAPAYKSGVSDYTHRLRATQAAIKNYDHLQVIDDLSTHGSISKILPALRDKFPLSQLVFLVGSDVTKSFPLWEDLNALFKDNELVVGLRGKDSRRNIKAIIDKLGIAPKKLIIFRAALPEAKSSKIRNIKSRII